ncbi:MAG: NAD-dependent succinate-semialdehyde dehydrogenase, partial [Acetobacteraceae bacterium]
GFRTWRKVSAFDRSKVMRTAADLLRERADKIAPLLTMEQGKPLPEAKGEVLAGADVIDWFAEEARRTYGRVVPARAEGIYQLVVKEPVGPVAAFTPWNFPINQVVRKLSCALAAGCSIIVKAPEETPASPAELIRCFADAGVPAGVINLVYGVPSEISEYLIPHPIIRKMSFTGSTAVGKQLAAIAGAHMKRVTMELGGHAPAIVFDDADVDAASRLLATAKYRNAGQVCVSPTRVLVQERVYDQFVTGFVQYSKAVKVGDGLESGTTMGPMANARRITSMETFIGDATQHGATLQAGGNRIGNKGNFFEPTVLTDVPKDARVMNEEPFGPLAVISPFRTFDEVVTEANRLPYGLASYAYTKSAKTANAIAAAVESGMISINHHGLALPEVPFGGVKDSGYGSEGGLEAIENYLNTKFVTQAGL